MNEALELIHQWTTKHTIDEIIELASLLRIPVAAIGSGGSVTEFDHFVERGTFVAHPGGDFVQPRVPYSISGLAPRPFSPAPRLGQHHGTVDWPSRDATSIAARAEHRLPLDGIRVLDFTAFWAGPSATYMLAGLGADVIKVESIQRPDGMRFSSTRPTSVDQWWEWGPVYHGANANKRAITLDMNQAEGAELARRLVAASDAVVENFTPRVMENFGLTWEAVHELNPAAVMVRMPAFGLDGPWRDRPGFAQTMEQISGMAWVTGFASGPPLIPRGACDPLAGMHAVFAFLVALLQRDRDGEGRLVEVTMVEAALNAAAEQVVEHGAYGVLLGRDGNHGPAAAPQNLYACAGDEEWLALAVATDEQWRSLRRILGEPAWACDAGLDIAAGRRAAHDAIDSEIASWCATQRVDDLVERLVAAGVPAASVVNPRDIARHPQLRDRKLFERLDHPVVGQHELPSLPFRFASRCDSGWLRRPAPMIGEHNDEVLGDILGLTAADLTQLRARAVIGDRPLGL
jgi:crotonobetainyl-CoA:carnitine CoA-transferase CaiB-like acyl-CoA transferase